MKVLLIQSNTVMQVVTTNSVADAQNAAPTYFAVAAPDPDPILVGVGFTTNDGGQTFEYPTQPAPISPIWSITRFAMMNRFTANEAIGIHMASQGTGQNAATVSYWLQSLNNATYVDLSANSTIQLVNGLVSFGLITEDRANTILQTPAAPNEKPGGV